MQIDACCETNRGNAEDYMSTNLPSGVKSPLEAAQKIVTELQGMPAEHQSLAVKFAVETLGLQLSLNASAPAPAIQKPQPSAPDLENSVDEPTDIRSFTAAKAPKSDRQFVAVVAYYYQFKARQDDRRNVIDAELMKEAARLAGRPQVDRWSMTLINAKNAGYLDAVGGGKFKLSSVGENLVAITLPGNGGQGQIKTRGSRKSKKGLNAGVKKTR